MGERYAYDYIVPVEHDQITVGADGSPKIPGLSEVHSWDPHAEAYYTDDPNVVRIVTGMPEELFVSIFSSDGGS